MKTNLPYFMLYTKDFISATSHMSPAEVGAYLRLLCAAWVAEPCATVPDDDEKLRRTAGADKEEWAQIKANVLEKFERDARFEGRLMNKRLRLTFEEFEEHREIQSRRGKKGAAKRWDKHEAGIDPSIAQAVREQDEEDA